MICGTVLCLGLDVSALEYYELSSSFHGLRRVHVMYDHTQHDEKREKIWNDSDRVWNRLGKRYRLCVMGDLNK